MKAQLIIYQLEDEAESSKINEQIKAFSKWARITDNCWMVITNKDSASIRDELRPTVNNKLRILVINITNQGWGAYAIPEEVTGWMKSNLRQD
jgi:hypothetical protein